VINWMLEVDDVDDVACTVDDMETANRSRYLVRRGLGEGRGDKSSRA
jgi:hypothetical protein